MPLRCPVFAAVVSKYIETTASDTPYSCNASATALACCSPVAKVSLGTPKSLSIFGPDNRIGRRVHVVLMSNLTTAFYPSEL